jgi:hypothetical protein
MAWTSTEVDQFVIGDRRCHVYDCVYGGTGYGGGESATGATGATGPTYNDLGFADTVDATFYADVYEVPRGATGAVYGRRANYDPYNQKLIVGATAAADISDTTYRVVAVGKYQR